MLTLTESFGSLEGITLAAATRPGGAVVVGTAQGVDDDPGGLHLAESVVSFQVEQVLSGDLQQGDVIPVVENGGIILDVIKDLTKPDITPTTTLQYLVQAGVPVMRSGERWLLFLTQFGGPVLPSGGYTTLGAYQGKFKIGEDGLITFTGPEGCLSSPLPEYALPAAMNGRSASEVIAETQALVAAAASQ